MTSKPPAASAAMILKARLSRLAADPRVALLPDGRAIARELGDVLAQLDDLDRRLTATELGFARLHELAGIDALASSSAPGPCE